MNWLNEIESYVEFFKKKRKFQISSIEGIKNILNSQKYYDFIEKLYNYYNTKVQLKENIRLSPKCYHEVNQRIDYFWESLLDNKSINEFILKGNIS